MKPREERIRIGGIDVHTWIGGDGAPLLVLHGAGGNRGFTRWVERVAQRFTVWAPTHPGFGLSGDAEWMDGIDDLARFYLWFMDVAGLVRPHVLGHSIGGWTAAEMATMSPGSIDRLILVAPAGLKPETGEILDVFYYPPPQLLPVLPRDGDDLAPDVHAIVPEQADLIQGHCIRAMQAEEFFRRQSCRYIGEGLMTEIFFFSSDHLDIVLFAFNVQCIFHLHLHQLFVHL